MQHHEIFSNIPLWEGYEEKEFYHDFLGIKTRYLYEGQMNGADVLKNIAVQRKISPTLPGFNEEYFEWIDIFESVKNAKDRFVMFELGAGFGRWIVRSAFALNLLNPMPFKFVAVEAEPTHFSWIKQHFLDNGIDPANHDLINKALNVDNKLEKFWVGNPSGWYGQAIQKETGGVRANVHERIKLLMRQAGIIRQKSIEAPQVILVPGTSLDIILKNYDSVDLIDIDVQGAELSILQHSINQINKKVKRIHIGTHSTEIEQGLRTLFTEFSWKCINDYKCGYICDTPYGKIDFGDGVQTWINPRFYTSKNS